MQKDLEKLSASELELILKAPILVCILIAGADNRIDQSEIKSAIHLAKSAQKKAGVSEIFRMAAEDFEDKFKIILQSLPGDAEQRNPLISQELAMLNPIFLKLRKTFTLEYFRCLLFVAKRIAESSGGMLGIHAVGEEEAKLLSLPMIKDPALL